MTYLNATDPAWQVEKGKHAESLHVRGAMRDGGEVYLCLATVLHYAPWVRKIFVATMAQQLDLRLFAPSLREKIEVVDHTSFIPSQFLPTFSSMAIEAFLHRIPGLQEHFIYLNDDMMFSRPFSKAEVFSNTPGVSSFFVSTNSHWRRLFAEPPPADVYIEQWRWVYYNAAQLLASRFGRGDRPGWHAGYLLRKASYKAAWAIYGSELNKTASHRFRTYSSLEEGGDASPIPVIQYTGQELGLQAGKKTRYQEIHPKGHSHLPQEFFQTGKLTRQMQSLPAFTLCQAFNRLPPEDAKGLCTSVVAITASVFQPSRLSCVCAEAEVGKACKAAAQL